MGAIDFVLTVGCLIVGILMLLGKGDKLLEDKNAPDRYKEYDMKKAQKGYGVAFLIIGAASVVSHKINTQAGFGIYLIIVVLALSGSVFYMKKYCGK